MVLVGLDLELAQTVDNDREDSIRRWREGQVRLGQDVHTVSP
jgi:hypothetical protein